MRRIAALLLLAACSSSTSSGPGAPAPGPSGTPVVVQPIPDDPTAALQLSVPGDQAVDEEKTLSFAVYANKSSARIFAEDLPPGATFDEATGTIAFTPDFLQGGRSWKTKLTAVDGAARVSATVTISANDTIRPLAPVITKTETMDGYARLTVTQTTDTYLDSPANAGRTFTAVVIAPIATSTPLPVRVGLHGFDGTPDTSGWSGEFRIFPSDPSNTYWWGYQASAGGPIADYTVRRVMNLLGWLLEKYPAADPERTYLDGVSMGGAGAMTIGLLHARHFCHVRASYGQAIPRNHRPSRIAQLRNFWGDPSAAWDEMDLTRALASSPEARDQFLTIHHAKDDPTIHFGAVTMPSPLTHTTYYASLQSNHVGHLAIWDEGGHVVPDPVLGDNWWSQGWDPVFDATALVRRHLAFVAFSKSTLDRDPGTGASNGKRAWNAESGYAGDVATPGDTGWDGDIAGGINRFLRWDGTKIVDTLDRFEIPIHVAVGNGSPPPKAGYPTKGDALDGVLPATVDVTPRRVQAFVTKPGEHVSWTAGEQKGTVTADETGAITIPALRLDSTYTTLVITRTN